MINNITQILIENIEKNKDKIAIIFKDKRISYHQLAEEMIDLASYYYHKGIRKDDKVLVIVPMSLNLYKILLAIFYLGATAVFLDSWSDKNRIEQALKIVKCKALIGIPKAHLLRFYSKQINNIPLKLVAGDENISNYRVNKNLQEDFSLDDIAIITLTTGSTGVPKAAKRTHRFLLEQHEALKNHFKPNINDIDLTTLPMFVLNNLALGTTTVIPYKIISDMDVKSVINIINKNRVNTSSGSPAFYNHLAKYCLSHKCKINNLNKIFLGGGPLYKSMAKNIVKAFPDTEIEVVYGSTEAEPISATNISNYLEYFWKKDVGGILVGKPVDSIDIKIIKILDRDYNIVTSNEFDDLLMKPFEVGEICVYGKHVLKEYYNSPEAQNINKINVDGVIWHRTGDAGYLDEDGNIILMGRVKNRVSFGGKDYYLFPVENRLIDIPEVNRGTLIQLQEHICLVIEFKKQHKNHKELIKKSLESLKVPYQAVILVDKIPMDKRHHSKIDYDKLNSQLLKKLG